jgi:hypothetical protein
MHMKFKKCYRNTHHNVSLVALKPFSEATAALPILGLKVTNLHRVCTYKSSGGECNIESVHGC